MQRKLWNYFDSLPAIQQAELIRDLVRRKKPEKYALKVNGSITEVARALAACTKYELKPEITRKGNKVIFIFSDMEDRNSVLLGMRMK